MNTANKIAFRYIGNPPKGISASKWNEQRNLLKRDIRSYSREVGLKLLERIADKYNDPDILLIYFDDIII